MISRALARSNLKADPNKVIHQKIVHTGQHVDESISSVFFDDLEIPKVDYNLGVCESRHSTMTGPMLAGIEDVLLDEKPDMVLVYGDTNSSLAGALVAAKLHIPVAHVEAGLRSYDKNMPEEINRVITDHISSVLFCPTDASVDNLRREGIIDAGEVSASPLAFGEQSRVRQCGDIMFDSALFYVQRSAQKSTIIETLGSMLDDMSVLVTVHRAENTDNPDRLRGIFAGLKEISRDLPLVLPLHPRTRKKLDDTGISTTRESLKFIDPVSYFDMFELLKHCFIVLTDSGGLQKEAYCFKTPCVTLRNRTEWTELVDHGYSVLLSGFKPEDIVSAFRTQFGVQFNSTLNLYGNGDAADHIVAKLGSI